MSERRALVDFMRIPPLETERLFIRPLRLSDLEAVRRLNTALANDDIGHPPITEPEHVRDWLTWSELNYEQLARIGQLPYGDRAVVLKGTRQLVGLVGNVATLAPFGLIPSLRGDADEAAARLSTCELGVFCAIAPTHQRRGYAREALRALIDYDLEHLRLRRIIAFTRYDNLASQALMRSVGMRVERNPGPDPAWFQVVGFLTARL